jgi:hypothetical protein
LRRLFQAVRALPARPSESTGRSVDRQETTPWRRRLHRLFQAVRALPARPSESTGRSADRQEITS